MESNLRILHLEDNEADAELLAHALSRAGLACGITRVDTRDTFLATVRGHRFDLVLSDFSLADFDGLGALDLFREHDRETPFIFVSGTIGEDRAVESLRRGATDYVLKDRLSRLPPAIERALAERREREARRLAEEQIREQAALLNEAREAIVVLDLAHRVTFWNSGASQMFGWTAEEARAGAADARIPPDQDEAVANAWRAVLAAGTWDGSLVHQARDGREVVVECHWTCLRHPDGTPRAVLTIGADVTEARSVERQLRRAQRLEAVGMIAGGVAHDLNNVLAPVMMGVSSLKRRVGDEGCQRLLSTMEVSIERGAAIVSQVLSFARGGSKAPGTFDTREMIRGIEALLKASLPRTIELTLRVAEDLRPLAGDPTQLQQVLLNLCVNARDAMPHGGTLLIEAENVSRPDERVGAHVLIRVRDTGLGMSPEVQARIFDPFFTTKVRGSGIGLSTVAAIVARHGGVIELESTPSLGTEFRVFLPVPVPKPADAAAGAPPAAGIGRGQTLLVVDEVSLREIMKETLETYGYQVVCAGTAAQALELYEQNPGISGVLVNLSIPEIDAFVQRLAVQDPRMKFIGTSGPEPGREGIVSAVLPKPYSALKLLEVVGQIVGKA